MDPQHIAAFSKVHMSEYLTVEENWRKLNKFIEDYEAVKSSLTSLSEKSKHPVMVPFGNVGFMSGSLVRTNDVLVLLGDNWFVEQSAKQTVDILNRRIAALQTQADDLQTRMQQIKMELSCAKGLAEESRDTVEIVEPYDEEFEQHWKTQHDANVRNYRQEIKESSSLDANNLGHNAEYDQIWRRLEQLEMEEEEEETEDGDGTEEGKGDACPSAKLEQLCDQQDDSENTVECSQAPVINFKHSVTGFQIRERRDIISSPADIYDKFCVRCSSATSSISAADSQQSEKTEHSQSRDMSSETSESESHVESHVAGSQESEMLQSSVATDMCGTAAEPTVRKVSKFKASRLKK